MTPKQLLAAHLKTMHSQNHWPPRRPTFADLVKAHARAHHQFYVNHDHVGPNTGPADRPPGWRTGEDPVPKVKE